MLIQFSNPVSRVIALPRTQQMLRFLFPLSTRARNTPYPLLFQPPFYFFPNRDLSNNRGSSSKWRFATNGHEENSSFHLLVFTHSHPLSFIFVSHAFWPLASVFPLFSPLLWPRPCNCSFPLSPFLRSLLFSLARHCLEARTLTILEDPRNQRKL